MGLNLIDLFLFVICLEIQVVHNQYWNGYGSCDPCTYYGNGQPCFTQTSSSGVCPQLGCDNYQSYNPYRSEQPIVIVIDHRDEDDSWMDVLNLISSLQNHSNGPVYIPYPVTTSNCDNDSTNSCVDCVCKNRGCSCSDKCENYDIDDNDCNCNCGCRNKEKISNCNSGKYVDSNCKKNVLLHKSNTYNTECL